jgi:hypothetical protein
LTGFANVIVMGRVKKDEKEAKKKNEKKNAMFEVFFFFHYIRFVYRKRRESVRALIASMH